MENDRHAVAGELNVELPGGGAGFPAQPAGLERVLGCPERIAAMRHDHRMIALRLEQREESIHALLGDDSGEGRCRMPGADALLDEQHLLIRRQRPEVVGDDQLELIGGGADGVHGGDDHVAGVLGVRERIAFQVIVDRSR